jgi:hypothetical protein
MAASRRLSELARGRLSQKLQVASFAFLVLVLVPTAALFCLQWSSISAPDSTARISALETAASNPMEGKESPGSWIASFIKPAAGSGQMDIAGRKTDDPFHTNLSREMISAQGDPFLAALASGVSEGVLVVRGKSDGVLILGPSLPRNFKAQLSDQEILKAIQSGVGGSFTSFFSNLFGNPQHESTMAAASLNEENPFSKAMESVAENHTSDKASAPAEAKAEQPATKEQTASSTSKENSTANPIAASSVSEPHPHLILSVDDQGVLHAVPVSQPRPGVFQGSEIGVMNLPLLPFGDTADFSGSIAVADFNGDGHPDVAYYVPMQGLVRFFYGGEDGSFAEGLRIDIGKAPRVLAAGDFNNDGQMDLAVSSVGSGIVTVLFADSQNSYRFKSYWIDTFRNYMQAADTTGLGSLDLVGMNFNNNGTVLIDFSQPDGTITSRTFDYTPSLNSSISTSTGQSSQLNAVVLDSSLSLSLDNQRGQLTHVLNVLAGTKIYVVVGDLYNDGRLIIGLAIPHP